MNFNRQFPSSEDKREMAEFFGSVADDLTAFLQSDPKTSADHIEISVTRLFAVLRELDWFLQRCEAQDWPQSERIILH